ncbi:MAG TPA: tetratricopeptide repeat protein [Rhizomicrobium sp.]|nr:tetratricopeptide repeat protein [Rhizomicrobium sp.]
MLGCSVIAVPAQAGWFDSDSTPAAKTDAKADAKNAAAQPATTLDDSIRQAQMLRLAGSYPEAIKHLSQLMLVAGDDSRVISEYGKTLAAMGRASDAVNFLTRAQQLQPNDWTVYSALGVAYDQIGDQKSAQINYGQALKLNPEEPSVLSNYALSRMLAKDPEMARSLAARAEKAGGGRDAIIARNIAMIRSIAPEAPVQQVAQATVPAPAAASAAARAPAAVASNVQPQAASNMVAQGENRVVMQKVPVDPLAGPIQTAAKPSSGTATSAPRPLQAKPVEALVTPAPVKAAEPAPIATAPVVAAKVTPPAPVKTVAVKAVPVKFSQPAPLTVAKLALAPIKIAEPAATPPAPVKAAEVKPAPAKPAEPVATAKLTPAVPVKAAETKPVAVAPVAASKLAAPVKADVQKPATASVTVKMAAPVPVKAAETAKPEAAPKVLVSTPVKAAEAKPLVKTVGQSKDTIPGLRMSANAY